jgi:hypothetical protein
VEDSEQESGWTSLLLAAHPEQPGILTPVSTSTNEVLKYTISTVAPKLFHSSSYSLTWFLI